MSSIVYYASPRQTRLDANETLPLKLDRIVDSLHIRDRVRGESVAIKMHLGGNVGYSTLHPVFVRRVVQAVKDGGGRPFIVDLNWSAGNAAERGYTAETVGCSVFPTGGLDEHYYYRLLRTRSRTSPIGWWAGMLQDATFLIHDTRAHQGHPLLRLRRGAELAPGLHDYGHPQLIADFCHYDPWFPSCTGPVVLDAIIASCPLAR